MKKQADQKTAPKSEPVAVSKPLRVFTFTHEQGAYCLTEFEIPVDVLVKSATQISRTEPDIFAIFLNHITKRAREVLGI